MCCTSVTWRQRDVELSIFPMFRFIFIFSPAYAKFIRKKKKIYFSFIMCLIMCALAVFKTSFKHLFPSFSVFLSDFYLSPFLLFFLFKDFSVVLSKKRIGKGKSPFGQIKTPFILSIQNKLLTLQH